MVIGIREYEIKKAMRFFDEFILTTCNEFDCRKLFSLSYLWLNAAKINPVVDDSVVEVSLVLTKSSQNGARRFARAEAQLQYTLWLGTHNKSTDEISVISVDFYQVVCRFRRISQHSHPHARI